MARDSDRALGGPAVPDDLRRLFAEQSASFRERRERHVPDDIAFGQLWALRISVENSADVGPEAASDSSGVPHVVMVVSAGTLGTADADALIALPLSVELSARSSHDFIIYEGESPLGYPFMVEVWHEMTLLRSQLGRYLGELSLSLSQNLFTLYRSGYDPGVSVEHLADRVGAPIWSDDDPRAAFQQRELASWATLQQPAFELLREQEPALRMVIEQESMTPLASPGEADEPALDTALESYRRSENLDNQGLAAALGCSIEALESLRTSQRPRLDPALFRHDVEEIAERFGVRAGVLAKIVRRADALAQLRRLTPTDEQGLLMAARDRREPSAGADVPRPEESDPEGPDAEGGTR